MRQRRRQRRSRLATSLTQQRSIPIFDMAKQRKRQRKGKGNAAAKDDLPVAGTHNSYRSFRYVFRHFYSCKAERTRFKVCREAQGDVTSAYGCIHRGKVQLNVTSASCRLIRNIDRVISRTYRRLAACTHIQTLPGYSHVETVDTHLASIMGKCFC